MGSFFQRAVMPWKGGIQGMVNSVDPMYNISGKTVLDPATLAGRNSWIAKEASYDPLMHSGAGKYIDPAAANAGQAYSQRHVVGSTPTPYAGAQPTLSAANNGYLQQSQMAARQKAQPQQPSVWGT